MSARRTLAIALVGIVAACGTSEPRAETRPATASSAASGPPIATAGERPAPSIADATAEPDEAPGVAANPDVPAPCPPQAEWPEGMACVLGGWFERGDAHGRPDERPPERVWIDTFYMDLRETTNAEYERCIEAGRCQRPIPFRRFMGANQPMVAVSWFDARNHCEMLDKRLPTEAEWERAARGPENTRYPWGDEPLGCERANVEDARGKGCGRDVTLPVGSLAPGHFGLFDMAGNVHEWVLDWYTPCYRGCEGECGDECAGRNPRGPCGGADRCPGRSLRGVRGGSWHWPLERARATARRGSGAPNRGPHRFGFRCARDLQAVGD